MTASPSFRPLLAVLVGVALLSQSGCVWLRHKFANTAVYEDSEQLNPLEVPPGLDVPNTAAGVGIPDVTPNPNVAEVPTTMGPAPAAVVTPVDGFALADTVESAFRRVGVALGKIDGVVLGASAEAAGTHTVTYQGTPMLIRVEGAGDGARVTAASVDGTPLSAGPAATLLSLLKARLG
jgi:uncharacterized lipoprotein